MPHTTAVIIPTEGEITTTDLPNDTSERLAKLQTLVNGYIEPVDLNEDLSIFVNEEGKIARLPHNPRATALFNGTLTPGDYIAGTAVLIGQPDSDGDATSVNLTHADRLLGTNLAD